MQMGLSDYTQIATAVGLPEAEVRRIDRAEDPRVRRLAAQGVPDGTHFNLAHPLRCPKCKRMITLVPCVACHSSSA
jgi:hypothetical protein